MSTSGGIWKALQRGRSIRCETIQIFVKNNMQWLGKPFSQETSGPHSLDHETQKLS